MPVTWTPQLGTWDASSGDYIASGVSPKITVAPGHILGDTSVRSRVRAEGNVGVCLGVRRGPGPVGYAGCLLPDGRLGFNRVDGAPTPVLLGFSTVPLNVAEHDVMLQIDAIGSELSIWAWPVGEAIPTEPHFTVSDSTYAMGSVGLIVSLAGSTAPFPGAYRFVHVANTHIPEPSTLLLTSLAFLVALFKPGRDMQPRWAWATTDKHQQSGGEENA